MKTMKFKNILFSAFLSGLLFASCSKDGSDGAIGPQGPQGELGAEGTAGAEGEQGLQGETGTANVIYSDWIDSEFDNNIIATGASFSIDAPLMTDEIINNGVIIVFGRSNPAPITNDTDVYGLPVVFGASRQQSYYFRAEAVGQLNIVVAANEQGDSVGSPFFGEYRYVLIPGGQSTEGNSGPGDIGSKTSAIDFTKMSYEELIGHFNIPK